jgi:acyl-CoA thioester hydrolase
VRHVYECPTRWGDLDLLGHVNNVVYVDYLQEARVDMFRTHARSEGTDDLAEGVVVVRHEVTYSAPLHFRFRPVTIECWVSEIRAASFTLSYEVFHEDPDAESGRRVYLKAASLLTPYVFATESPRRITPDEKEALGVYLEEGEPRVRPERFRLPHDTSHLYPVHVRFSDVDVYRHVNNVKYLGYFQEARIRLHASLMRGLPTDTGQAANAVARTEVDYLAPILLRPEPYDCWSRVSRLGDRSITIESEICDGDTLLSRARVVSVFLDAATGQSVRPPEAYRERVEAAITDFETGRSAPRSERT